MKLDTIVVPIVHLYVFMSTGYRYLSGLLCKTIKQISIIIINVQMSSTNQIVILVICLVIIRTAQFGILAQRHSKDIFYPMSQNINNISNTNFYKT